jgi:hypothetical protein
MYSGMATSANESVQPPFKGILRAIQVGQVEFNVRKTVHLVAYFRYYRFFPDGSLLYRTTPQVVSLVAKAMRQKPKAALRRDDNLYSGRYCIKVRPFGVQLKFNSNLQTQVLEVWVMQRSMPCTRGGLCCCC